MVPESCSLPECDKQSEKRGYCNAHYLRLRNYGDPRGGGPLRSRNPKKTLEAKTVRIGRCLVWMGGASKKGYGAINVNGKQVGVHRYAYELAHGPIPEGMFIDHRCHNKTCVEPKHLRAITTQQNNQNRSGAEAGSATGIRGVVFHKQSKKYAVSVGHGGNHYYGGLFTNIASAERAAVMLRNELHSHNDVDRGANISQWTEFHTGKDWVNPLLEIVFTELKLSEHQKTMLPAIVPEALRPLTEATKA